MSGLLEGLTWENVTTCAAARWSPRIGDPDFTGWLTVAAYVGCGLLAVWLVVGRAARGRERVFWALIGVAMLFLAINKQLDLQSALTAVGRCIAGLQGWYEDRRSVQHAVILGLIAAILIVFCLFLYLFRKHLWRNGLALTGLVLVAGYVSIRAVGFHHFETLINTSYLNMRLNFLFELSGLFLIALNALALLFSARRRDSNE